MRSYETARSLYGFLGFCAWCVIVIGGIFALIAGSAVSTGGFGGSPSAMQVFLAVIPGGLVAMAGVYGLAMVQNGRTSVDVAEYTQQALDVSRQQLDISKQMLAQGKTMEATYAALMPPLPMMSSSPSKTAEQPEVASYAKQPSPAPVPATEEATAVTSPAVPTPEPVAVAKKEQVLLEPARNEIIYQDGRFVIDDKTFLSKGDALIYRDSIDNVARSN